MLVYEKQDEEMLVEGPKEKFFIPAYSSIYAIIKNK